MKSANYYFHKSRCVNVDARYAEAKLAAMRLQLVNGKLFVALPLFIYNLWYIHLLNKYNRIINQFRKAPEKDYEIY